MTTVSVSIVAVFHLLEYEVVCVAGYNGPTEDILGICPEGKMAYITYSNMRCCKNILNNFIIKLHRI